MVLPTYGARVMSAERSNQLHKITPFILSGLLGLLPIFGLNEAECAEKPSVPNIVLILADDKD